MIALTRRSSCGEVDRPTMRGSALCLVCATGEPSTVLHIPGQPHECDLVQPAIAGIQTGETWAQVGTIQRCNVCGRIWLAEPPIRVSRGQQSAANRWVEISWRRARRIMRHLRE